MARSVADAALMLQVMSGRDSRDWAQGLAPLHTDLLTEGVLHGSRIGYWWNPPCGHVEHEVAAIVEAAVRRIGGLGAYVERIELPGSNLLEIFQHHWFAGAANRLKAVPREIHREIDPGLREIAAAGNSISGSGLVAAQLQRAEFGAAMDRLLAEYDFLVSPGVSIAAFSAGQEVPSGSGFSRWMEWAGFSFPINLSQQPACVVPCGQTLDGRPVGLQFVGARWADAKVLSAAQDFERLLPNTPLTHGIGGGEALRGG